jgi:hypothetical protein
MHNQNDLNAAQEFAVYLRPHYHMSPNQIMELANIISNHRVDNQRASEEPRLEKDKIQKVPFPEVTKPSDESPEPA